MDNYYIKEDMESAEIVGRIALTFFITWLLMLILGSLAERLDVARLAIDYWTTFLILLGARMLQRHPISKWKVSKGR